MKKNQPAAAAPAPAPIPSPAPAPAPVAPPEKPNLQGKYRFVKNEEFEDYLAAIGMSWVARKMALHASHDLTIVQDGDKLTIKQDGREISFTVGEEFEDKQNGHVMKVSPQWDGVKLVLSLEPKEEGKGKAEKQTRELKEEELILTLELGETVARRIFNKVPDTK